MTRHSWTIVRLPERDLSELIHEFAAPLLDRLGSAPAVDDARAAITLAVTFWNANVLASKRWDRPRVKELNELKKRMRGKGASREDAATFDLLAEHWHKYWLDPRLVESWTYEPDAAGAYRFVCTMSLPDGVKAEVPPPAEKRIAIGGKFLDEVRVPQTANTLLVFPIEHHRGVVGDDDSATVYTKMPTALKLFADGLLPSIGGNPVEVAIGVRNLGPMVLNEVRCGESLRHDVAVLTFRPASVERRT